MWCRFRRIYCAAAALVALLGCRSALSPEYPSMQFGSSIALSDVTCDGNRDLIVGAPGHRKVLVYPVTAVPSGEPLAELVGAPGSSFGSAIAGTDLEADGCEDLLVAAPGSDQVYIYGGSDEGPVLRSVLDGPPGFGRSLATANIPELGGTLLLVGSNASATLYRLVDGAAQTPPIWAGQQQTGGEAYGTSVAFGHVLGSSAPDVIVGDPHQEVAPGGQNQGTVYAYEVLATDVDPTPTVLAAGLESQEQIGRAMVLGELAGDGATDLAVGTPLFDTHVSGGGLVVMTGVPNGPVRAVYPGVAQADFGQSISAVDVDQDGESEILVGAPGWIEDSIYRRGAAFLYDASDVSASDAVLWEVLGQYESQRIGAVVLGGEVAVGGGAPARPVAVVSAPGVDPNGLVWWFEVVNDALPDLPQWEGAPQ